MCGWVSQGSKELARTENAAEKFYVSWETGSRLLIFFLTIVHDSIILAVGDFGMGMIE